MKSGRNKIEDLENTKNILALGSWPNQRPHFTVEKPNHVVNRTFNSKGKWIKCKTVSKI